MVSVFSTAVFINCCLILSGVQSGCAWSISAIRRPIESDGEVAFTFHPETLQPLSVPLVNIRATLEYAVDRNMIDPHKRNMLLKIAKSMYYPDRLYHALVKKGVEIGIVSISVQDEFINFFVNYEVDVKRDDTLMVIEKIRHLL